MKWFFVVVLLCLLMGITSGSTFEDSVQYHVGDDLTDLWNTTTTGTSTVTIASNSPVGYTYSKVIQLYSISGGTASITNKLPFANEYWAFNARYWNAETYSSWGVFFYDEDGNLIDTNNYYMPATAYCGRLNDGVCLGGSAIGGDKNYEGYIELRRVSGQFYLRVNGTDMGAVGDCNVMPYYMRIIMTSTTAVAQGGTVHIDDITTNEGIVGIGHQSNPYHNITELDNKELDVSWDTTTIPIGNYIAAQYDLKVKRATWGEWYNSTQLKIAGNSTALPYGFVVYNWSTLFQTDHYGLYLFELYKTAEGESELSDSDFLFFKDVGQLSTINIEDIEYAIGETLNISYYIDSPDFGANQYKIQIFDSTGQLKDTRVLTLQAATEQITSTIDWEEGMLYAVLVKDTKPAITEDPPEDIIDLAYDFCTMSNVIYVTGKIYDASNADMLVDGTLLDNVSLNWTQAGTIYNTTSDANGNYEFTDATTLLEVEWFQDVPIEVTASKTNYTHDNFTMTIIKAGRYTVDIYLTPDVNMSATAINGLVQDDIFHQAIPQATVKIWNGITNSTYTNNWGWYEFTGLANGTYYMTAEKETYRTSSVVTVPTFDVSYVLDTCDNLTYYEAVLDDCDATTGWSSDNTLTLNTTDYIEATGSLQSRGYNTTDFNKTFSPGIDSNVSAANGYFYFYSKILSTTNISSTNITVTISSNTTGTTDKRVWLINKTFFNDTWDLYSLKMSDSVQTGTCNLSNITYFEFKSTKTDNVTTRIDYLAFIEYAGWDSCIDLEIDTANKVEGTGSLNAAGKLYPTCDLVLGMFWTPAKDCTLINKNSDKSRLIYSQWDTQVHTDNVYLFDSDGDYMMWAPVMDPGWDSVSLYFSDAVESGDFETSKLSYLSVYSHTINYYDVNYDYVHLMQKGDTRQNFLLSQNYNLTVYAKDADTRYTITSFTAILDSTTVAETTTAAIVFPNVTYGIYPLEVSAEGYYTNKQYVFMGQDTTQTVYLTKIENVSSVGVGQAYAPIPVEFRVIDMGGNPKQDVLVTAVGTETTMGAWSWLQDIFGYSSKVELQNTSMNGTTDSMGHLTFIMVETIKYKINFTKPSEGINETLYFYPKEKQYTIYVTSPRAPTMIDNVDWNLSVREYNATHSNLTLAYNDTMAQTSNLRFFVNDENRSELWNVSFTQSVIDTGYIVEKSSGQSYFWGFNATHDTFGEFESIKAITFKSRLIDLRLATENEHYYTWISICLLVMIATLFSAITSKFGYVVIPFMGGFFYWIGWLEISVVILSVVIFMGVILYMTKREREIGI